METILNNQTQFANIQQGNSIYSSVQNSEAFWSLTSEFKLAGKHTFYRNIINITGTNGCYQNRLVLPECICDARIYMHYSTSNSSVFFNENWLVFIIIYLEISLISIRSIPSNSMLNKLYFCTQEIYEFLQVMVTYEMYLLCFLLQYRFGHYTFFLQVMVTYEIYLLCFLLQYRFGHYTLRLYPRSQCL
jgi:hypothetical protein